MIKCRASQTTGLGSGGSGTNSYVLGPCPSGAHSGDLIVAALLLVTGSAQTVTPPAGWSVLAYSSTSSVQNDRELVLLARTADGTEGGATYTFTGSASVSYGWNFVGYDVLYDDGGGSLSTYGSTGGLANEPWTVTTTHNWDAAYFISYHVDSNTVVSSPWWKVFADVANNGANPLQRSLGIAPTAGSLTLNTYGNLGVGAPYPLFVFTLITGATAPASYRRLRGRSVTSTSSSTFSAPAVAGIQDNDFMLALITTDSATQPTISGGWTYVGAKLVTSTSYLYLFKRTAAGEPGTYTGSVQSSAGNVLIVAFYDSSGKVLSLLQSASASGTGSVAPAVLTAASVGNLIAVLGGSKGSDVVANIFATPDPLWENLTNEEATTWGDVLVAYAAAPSTSPLAPPDYYDLQNPASTQPLACFTLEIGSAGGAGGANSPYSAIIT